MFTVKIPSIVLADGRSRAGKQHGLCISLVPLVSPISFLSSIYSFSLTSRPLPSPLLLVSPSPRLRAPHPRGLTPHLCGSYTPLPNPEASKKPKKPRPPPSNLHPPYVNPLRLQRGISIRQDSFFAFEGDAGGRGEPCVKAERDLFRMKISAIYGSPRRNGNTAILLREAVRGAKDAGAQVEEIVIRDLKISPCLELYGCKETGQCAIRDDFQQISQLLLESKGIMLASPIFFYTVSAHTKILMDRCQSLWVKKYWIEKRGRIDPEAARKGLFISVGATRGKKLFDGTLLTVRYFFDVLDTVLWKSLLYRGLDQEGEVKNHPQYLEECYRAGVELAESIRTGDPHGPTPF